MTHKEKAIETLDEVKEDYKKYLKEKYGKNFKRVQRHL